jgi:hypothetical protein
MNSIFNSRQVFAAVGAALLTATLMASPSISLAQDGSGYQQYRCTVLGDSRACPPPSATPADRVEVQTVVGPYALYLMHLGQNEDSAIKAARASGEVPIQRTVRVTTRQLSARESYERYLGRTTAPVESYQILAEAPVEAEGTQACMTASDLTVR